MPAHWRSDPAIGGWLVRRYPPPNEDAAILNSFNSAEVYTFLKIQKIRRETTTDCPRQYANIR